MKNYITPEGYSHLKQTFDHLLKIERPRLVETIRWAASNGDRSENGDYIYGKRRLRQIDAQLKKLIHSMELAVVVDSQQQINQTKIYFGAWIKLWEISKEITHNYRIVGRDEIDLDKGYISWISPMAKALMGKQVGDEILVITAQGKIIYEVEEVRYGE